MLLDSNIIIYACKPTYARVRAFLRGRSFAVSAVTKVEVLGYWRLSDEEYQRYETFFNALDIIHVSPQVIERAIALRRLRSIGLADAVIASTALIRKMPLITHNLQDFQWIQELEIFDPVKD